MSSLSSIENEKEIFYNSFRVNEAYPWYPTLAQPLIYYSEVNHKDSTSLQQQKHHRRSKEKKKNTPNCFVKAFRWYTEEHVPNSRTNKVDIKDFATWLDEKYNDFLQNSHTQYIYNETSTIEMVASSNKVDKKERKSMKQSRLSPWKKQPMPVKNMGDVMLRSSHSIEVILKPKQLTRPASECCQRSKAQSRNQINSTTQSNTSVVEKKLKPKSQSLTSILKEREIYVIPFDIPQDVKNDIEDKKKSAIIISKRDSAMKYKNSNIKNITCQCSHVMLNRADASCQFEKKTSKSNICLCNDVEPTALRKRHIILETHQIIQGKDKKKDYTMESRNVSHSTFLNDSVQTSDHLIDLGEKIEYPIFMKLICPDKMKENDFLRTQT